MSADAKPTAQELWAAMREGWNLADNQPLEYE